MLIGKKKKEEEDKEEDNITTKLKELNCFTSRQCGSVNRYIDQWNTGSSTNITPFI